MNREWTAQKMEEWRWAAARSDEEWVVEVNSIERAKGLENWHPWYEGTSQSFMLPTTLENCIEKLKLASHEHLVYKRPEDYRIWNIVTGERIPMVVLGL